MAVSSPRSARTRAPLPWIVLVVSVGVPLVLLAAVDLTMLQLGPGQRFTGYARGDLLYYSANARELFENGNGLFYGNPFSASETSPRVYSHLQLVILGWTWHLTGVPLPVLWQVAQIVCGTLMFLALYRLLACFFSGRTLDWAFVITALGNGGVAAKALWTFLGHAGTGNYLKDFRAASVVTIWFPNVFQNACFTTEAFYHALAFWVFAAVLRGRLAAAVLGVFLLWWSHPFTGLEAAGIVGAYALLEAVLQRSRRFVAFAAAVAAVSAGFLAYNLVFVPRWSPEAADVVARWRMQPSILHLVDLPAMLGLFLIGPLLLLHRSARPPRFLADPRIRFLLVWLGVVSALVLHDRVTWPPFQPLHFSHGYIFVPLATLTMLAAGRPTRAWRFSSRRLAAVAFLVAVSVDNVLFTIMLGTSVRPVLAAGLGPVVDRLAAEPPGLVLVEPFVPLTADYLTVVTAQRVYLGNPYVTPFFKTKAAAVETIMESPSPATGAAALGIRWIVGPVKSMARFEGDVAAGRARLAVSTGTFGLLEVTAADAGAARAPVVPP